MGRTMIINGSPRAPKSNSKRYAEIFMKYHNRDIRYFNLKPSNYTELISHMEICSNLVLIFPLYADSLPVGLLNFLKYMEENPPTNKPAISILINCGFLEHEQNNIAIDMIKFYCRKNGFKIGSILSLGSGEAILDTPFKFIARNNIRKFSKSISSMKYDSFQATMPLPKKIFIWASTNYWKSYGKKFGITKQNMQTMHIEDM